MFKILDHLELTRRKRVTHIVNGVGGLMWSGKSTGHAIAWLIENGHSEASMDVEGSKYELKFSRWPF